MVLCLGCLFNFSSDLKMIGLSVKATSAQYHFKRSADVKLSVRPNSSGLGFCVVTGTKGDVSSATLPMCPISRRRQQPIFTLSWPKLCSSKLEETLPRPFSPSPQPAAVTRAHTETCISVPLRSGCTLLASTTSSHPTGSPELTHPMCPGSPVRERIYEVS